MPENHAPGAPWLIRWRWTVEKMADEERRTTRLTALARGPAPELTLRQRQILGGLLRGESYGELAFDHGLQESTVATHADRGLAKLGLTRCDLALLGGQRAARRVHRTLDVPQLFPELTPAAQAVVAHVLTGASNRSIACRRGRSRKTVANQIRGIFETLGLFSRYELMHLAATREAGPPTMAA